MDLTPKQVEFIEGWVRIEIRTGRTPTYRELMDELGYKYPNSVAQIVKALRNKGVIRVTPEGDQVIQYVLEYAILVVDDDTYVRPEYTGKTRHFSEAGKFSLRSAQSYVMNANKYGDVHMALVPIPHT